MDEYRCPRCGSDEIGDMEEIIGVGWLKLGVAEIVTVAQCWKCGMKFQMHSTYIDSGEFTLEPINASLDKMELSKRP